MKYFIYVSMFFFVLAGVSHSTPANAQEKIMPDPLQTEQIEIIANELIAPNKILYAYKTLPITSKTNEIVSERTENSIVYDLGNGQKQYEIFSGVPQFYKAPDSLWYQVEYGLTDTKTFQEKNISVPLTWFQLVFHSAIAQTTYYTGSGDGYVGYQNANWASARGATTGDTVNDTTNIRVFARWNGANYFVYRGFLPTDTSAIDDGATITNAVLKTYLDTVPAGNVTFQTNTTSQASPTGLTTADIDAVSDTSLCTFQVLSSASQYTEYTCTLSDLTGVSKTGYSYYGLREYTHDALNSAPTTNYETAFFGSENTGTTYDPILVITVSGGGGGGGSSTSTSATSTPEEIMAISQFSFVTIIVFFLSLTSTIWIWTRYI